MSVEIEVADDPARACAAMLVGVAAGGGDIVLTGGSTPRVAYGEFVEAVRTVGIDVSRCNMWFSDERAVPVEDERSNYGMVNAALLEPLGEEPHPVVHRMRGELGPQEAAAEYEREFRASIWSCWGSDRTVTWPRCFPTNRRCRSAPGWCSGWTRQAGSPTSPASP